MHYRAIYLFTWVAASLCIGTGRAHDDAERLLDEGQRLYARGRRSGYVHQLQHARRHFNACVELYQQAAQTDAPLASGASRDVHLGQAKFYLGSIALLLGDLDHALGWFSSSLQHALARKAAAQAATVLENLGVVQSRRREWVLAAHAFLDARHHSPHHTRFLESAGRMYFHGGMPIRGATLFHDAVYQLQGGEAHTRALASAHYELARMHELLAAPISCHGQHQCFSSYARHVQLQVISNFSQAYALTLRRWRESASRHDGAVPRTLYSMATAPADSEAPQRGLEEAHVVHQPEKGAPVYRVTRGDTSGPGVWPAVEFVDRSVVRATLRNVLLCGKDAVIVHRDTCAVVSLSFGVHVPLHRNLPMSAAPVCGSKPSGLRPQVKVLAQAVLLVQVFCTGYYHFMVETLPRVLLALEHYPSAPLLVSADGDRLHGYMSDLLHGILRIPTRRLVMYDVGRSGVGGGGSVRMSVRHLHVIDWEPDGRPPRTEEVGAASWYDATHCPARWALRLVRRRLSRHRALRGRVVHAHEVANSSDLRLQHRRIVYVQRAKAAMRRLTPSAERRILRGLRRLCADMSDGRVRWRVVVHSDSPAAPNMSRTLELFSSADVVLGVHGAGLANCIVCGPGVALVEVALPEPHAQYYLHLAAALDLAYWAVPIQWPRQAAYAAQQVHVDAQRVLRAVAQAMQGVG